MKYLKSGLKTVPSVKHRKNILSTEEKKNAVEACMEIYHSEYENHPKNTNDKIVSFGIP